MRKKQSPKPFGLLLELLRGSRLLYIVALFFMILTVFLNFLLPQLIRFVVDNVIGGLPLAADLPLLPLVVEGLEETAILRRNLFWVGWMVALVAILHGVCSFIYNKTLAMGAEGMIRRLRDRLYRHIQHLPYSWHVKIMTGDIIQRCTSDVDVVRNFVANQLLEMIRTVVLVVLAYSLLFPINTQMALASFAFLPVVFLYSFLFLKKVSHRFLAADEAEGALLSIAQENFTGVRVVRAFGRERYEVDRFDKQNHRFADLWMHLGTLLSSYWGLGDIVTGLQMITICGVGVFEAMHGRITVGEFIVFLTYNSMTIWPVRGLGRILSEASKTGVSLGRLQEILHVPAEEDPPTALENPVQGDIAFDNVSFAYEDQPVLRNISFTVKEGSTLGILGTTGSGKTTVAHLLCRLYDLPEGQGKITIGGIDIADYKRQWLRQNVGIVLQEPFLYSRTIRDNVAALSTRYSMDQIREATRVSCIDDAITEFSHGYKTVVGERGVTLSGGQKQRVAIARALLKDPPILIFDDSLSAVDTETDARIREGLAARTQGVTTLIIAHRISSVVTADQIIVMDDGRIEEAGSPEQLMQQGGIYRRLYDMQKGTDDREEEGE